MSFRTEVATFALLVGCGPHASSADAPTGSVDATASAACVSSSQLAAWQAEIDQFDEGYRPTGSPAHEAYIAHLAAELTALGASDIHLEPFSFARWTPSSWSLEVLDGTGPIALSGYIPYSGATGSHGVTSPMVYLPASAMPIDAIALGQALSDPVAWKQALTARLKDAFATLQVPGRIVVFDVPDVVVSLDTLIGQRVFVNDPDSTLPAGATVSRTDLSAMLIVPAVLDALRSAGATGAVGILPVPAEAARNEYAPFFGVTTPDLPAVYVDRAHGEVLKHAISAHPFATSKLVLDATLGAATSENLIGVLPGTSDEEILVSSHTDGPNSMEDNGPVGILALASCLQAAPRPRTLRFVLSSGHFVASLGLDSYVASHTSDLTNHAKAVLELEHLGALEWAETSPDVMGLTGRTEMQLLSTWADAPLVDASIAYAKKFPRSVVAQPPIIGEGPNFRIVPLIQFITMPQYLLLGRLPAITTQLTDYALMQRQVDGFRDMVLALASAQFVGP